MGLPRSAGRVSQPVAVPRYVLVTGASSGIGLATTRLLAARGYHVLAGVRRSLPEPLLDSALPERVRTLVLDVTQEASIQRACIQAQEIVGERGLSGLINNAGIGIGGPVEYTPGARLREQFDVNFFGLASVIQAFMPVLRVARGRIVNISSIVARVPLPFFAPYSASKCAVAALSDCLRVEIRRSGVTVSLIEPGVIDTPMHGKGMEQDRAIFGAMPAPGKAFYAKAANHRFAAHSAMLRWATSAERVAQVIGSVLETNRPRARYVVGKDARVLLLLRTLLPRALLDRALGRLGGA